MKSVVLCALIAFALFVAPTSYAADGDIVASPAAGVCQTGRGNFDLCQAYKLCDDKTANGACAEMEIGTNARSLPDSTQFSIENVTGCTGTPTVDILAANQSRTCTVASSVCHTLTTLDATTTSVFIGGSGNPLPRFISADIAGLTLCSDFEVWMTLYYRKSTD